MTDLLAEALVMSGWVKRYSDYAQRAHPDTMVRTADDEVARSWSPDIRAALRERGVHLVTVESLARALHRIHSWDTATELGEATAILAALEEEA